MKKAVFSILIALFVSGNVFAQPGADSIVLRDITWDKVSPAGMTELTIPSGNSLLQGFIYKANGIQKHPTLLLLHGYPGNERNLDLAQVVRAHGWNVIYFDYRGSWGSQGQFSFTNCVEDVKNVIAFCKKYADSLQIDISNIAIFGHSMGGWVCLKALQQNPEIKKGFALSTMNIYGMAKNIKTEQQLDANIKQERLGYFVINTPAREIFDPVIRNLAYYNLANDANSLADKQVVMLDEHPLNKEVADAIKSANRSYFNYDVWQTDHSFTNKRVALIKQVLALLDR